jgi:hypothetical protein
MGQGGKPSGKSGKPSGKSGKPSGKQGKQGKPSGKQGKQGSEQKNQKKGNNKSYSMVSLCLCVCLSIVYSIMIGYLGGTAIKTVGENPELLQMAKFASDSRLKKNVQQMNYGLKELTQLEPKSYNYITEEDTTKRHLGVMAQDLQKVMPELVVELDAHKNNEFKNKLPENIRDETLYGVKYYELIPVLINSIKELKQEVDTLKQQIR